MYQFLQINLRKSNYVRHDNKERKKYLPLKVDAKASVRGEEASLHVVEVVVVLEQQGDPVLVPVHKVLHHTYILAANNTKS
jgi:hypothetical protein